jgi:6-phospho-beta-glucosidase
MKVAIVGGSAPSTPHLVLAAAIQPLLEDLEIVLVGTSYERACAVERAMRVLRPRSNVRASRPCELARCVEGAEIVVLQPRFGGAVARAYDEAFPQRFGIPGDEGLGPGGLAAAWRGWPQLERVLEAVERGAPNARVLLLTAPLGILTRCAFQRRPSVALTGICELPYATLLDVRAATGTNGDLTFEYAGVNHLGWFDVIASGGTNLIAAYARTRCGNGFPQRALLESRGALPLKYQRLAHEREAVVSDQGANSRAAAVAAIAEQSIGVFQTGDGTAIRAQLARRPAPWYDLAVAPYVAATTKRDWAVPFFFTTCNDGYLPALPNDDVLEVPHVRSGGRWCALRRDAPPPDWIERELRALVEFERVAAYAVWARDERMLKAALEAHPWVAPNQVCGLAEAIVAGEAVAASR